jgi:hypothetical protein
MSENSVQDTSEPQAKAQYCTPCLIEYGSITELTLGTGGTQTDGSPHSKRWNSKIGN